VDVRARLVDPLGTFLTWAWALGSAGGLVLLGVLVHDQLDHEPGGLPPLALSAPDTFPDDTEGAAS
jgi:hypothetical protein